MYKVIFFDFGETLVEAYPSVAQGYVTILEKFNLGITEEQMDQALDSVRELVASRLEHPDASACAEAYNRYTRGIMTSLLERLGVLKKMGEGMAEEILGGFVAIQDSPNRYRVYPDVRPTLEALAQRGFVLGILSNWDWHLPELVSALGLDVHFDYVITSAHVGYRKPHRGIFLHALKEAGISPEEAFMVGDNYLPDVQGAQGVGMSAILLDREETRQYPDLSIKDLVELDRYLDSHP